MSDVAREVWEVLGLVMGPKWNGMPIAGLVELAIIGAVLAVVSLKPTTAKPKGLAVRRPGWLARRRAS